jgi:AraC-like DNA-binding protein
MKLLNDAPRDTVTELLAAVCVRSSIYCLSDLGAPWGFAVDCSAMAKFHLVLDGACWLKLDGHDPVRLGPGELAILPRGERHTISDELGSPVTGLDQLIAEHPLDADARLSCGGAGPRTRLLCGGFALGGTSPIALLSLLPQVLTMDPGSARISTWLDPVFALVRQEASGSAPGAQVIFARLADVFLSQALRAYLAGPAKVGLLRPAPRRDPQIEAAVALIRDQPGRQWTLQALAAQVGMSRTLFATRFRDVTGESPIRYLAKVRLGRAAGYLGTAGLSLDAIAVRTGYGNNASLSKAFKREFGVSPGAYRSGGTGARAAVLADAEVSSPAGD